ncbi:MAG: ATP synthase F1 subunit delta [Candidatus Bipolaricaulota bacterium]|nr:ATP synthase F1 subunit delta [Candidatus Bipolaricaulota bacterium]
MTTPTELAHPYAQALYALGEPAGAVDALRDDLALLGTLWEGDERVRGFLTHPLVPASAKEDLLVRALAGRVHPLTLNLVRLLVRRGRTALLPELGPAFRKAEEERGRTYHVGVRTAQPLTPEAREALCGKLAALLGGTVLLDEELDPGLLGGAEVVVRGRRVDASLRGRLEALAQKLGGRP